MSKRNKPKKRKTPTYCRYKSAGGVKCREKVPWRHVYVGPFCDTHAVAVKPKPAKTVATPVVKSKMTPEQIKAMRSEAKPDLHKGRDW